MSSSQSVFSPVFIIGHIRIGSVEGASCVNLGNNWPTGFENHSKTNQGFGEVSGDHNMIRDGRSYLQDSDLIDMMDAAWDDGFPQWAKEMITRAGTASEAKVSENQE